jgi:hypothetical protein
VPVSAAETPERPTATPPRRPRRVSWRRGVLVAGVAVAVAGLTWWLGLWGGYEHQLQVAVRDIGQCQRTSTKQDWPTTDDPLAARASRRFFAACEQLGPNVTWLRYRNASDMGRAMEAARARPDAELSDPYVTVCISRHPAELVLFDGVDQWKVTLLCWLRGGRVARRGRNAFATAPSARTA